MHDYQVLPLADEEPEFGGREARLSLERKLLHKLDMRMSILVLIYILNYVRLATVTWFLRSLISVHRLTGTTFRESCNVFPAVIHNQQHTLALLV